MSDNPLKIQDNNTGWALIPPWVLADQNLSANEKLIAGRIWGLSGARGYCWARNASLGQELGLAPKTVSKIITLMNAKGYVRVEVVRNKKNEITQRRIYPLNPLCPNGNIGLPQRGHTYAPESGREKTVLGTSETTTNPGNPVVVSENLSTPKPPCHNGQKCNHYRDLNTVGRAIEIFKTIADTKNIKNPVGYVCMICRKGAILPRGFQTPAEIAVRKGEAAHKKAEEEREAAAKAALEEAVKTAFAKLPDWEKDKYINMMRQTMGAVTVGDSILFDVAAANWAQEANYAI